MLCLYRDKKYYHRRVARLVAQAFIPNPDDKPEVNHIDHVRDHDHVDNLEWVTSVENKQASLINNPIGKKTRKTITVDIVEKICEQIQEGRRNSDIVKDLKHLGVTLDIVKHIRSGATWTEISCNYNLKGSYLAVSEPTVRWVCRKIVEGFSNKEILEMSTNSKLTKAIIKNIKYKNSWVNISNEYF